MNHEPAFPYTAKTLVGWANDGTPNHVEDSFPGMTLRDYFAAEAINLAWKVFDEGYSPEPCSPENIAKFAYQMADAMLAERINP